MTSPTAEELIAEYSRMVDRTTTENAEQPSLAARVAALESALSAKNSHDEYLPSGKISLANRKNHCVRHP
jgi:hypothetical protein